MPLQLVTFDRQTLPEEPTPEECWRSRVFTQSLLHLMSLMHATACQALRHDADLNNLDRHCSQALAPPSVGKTAV